MKPPPARARRIGSVPVVSGERIEFSRRQSRGLLSRRERRHGNNLSRWIRRGRTALKEGYGVNAAIIIARRGAPRSPDRFDFATTGTSRAWRPAGMASRRRGADRPGLPAAVAGGRVVRLPPAPPPSPSPSPDTVFRPSSQGVALPRQSVRPALPARRRSATFARSVEAAGRRARRSPPMRPRSTALDIQPVANNDENVLGEGSQ